MVYSERAETAAVLCDPSHVTTKQRCKYATSVIFGGRGRERETERETERDRDTETQTDRQRQTDRTSHSFRITYEKSAVRLLESGERRFLKATYNGGRQRFHVHVDTHDMAFPLSASDTVPLTYQRLQLSVSRDV